MGSRKMFDLDSLDQGEVKAAFEYWIYYGNRDGVIALLNQPWAKTDAGKRIIKELEAEVREEKQRSQEGQRRMEETIERNDPLGMRYCNG